MITMMNKRSSNNQTKEAQLDLKALATVLCRSLCEDDEFEIETTHTSKLVVIEIQPRNQSALRRLIGSKGTIINSITTLLKAIGARTHTGVAITILEVAE